MTLDGLSLSVVCRDDLLQLGWWILRIHSQQIDVASASFKDSVALLDERCKHEVGRGIPFVYPREVWLMVFYCSIL